MIIIIKKFCLNLNQKIRDKTGASGTKDVEMIIRLNYLSNFWIIFHMSLITCAINLIVIATCSADCVISTIANQATLFAITDTKLYVLVLTFSC